MRYLRQTSKIWCADVSWIEGVSRINFGVTVNLLNMTFDHNSRIIVSGAYL